MMKNSTESLLMNMYKICLSLPQEGLEHLYNECIEVIIIQRTLKKNSLITSI